MNADDLGQSPGVNRGIFETYEHGIVTSASLMVRWPAAAKAAAYCRSRPCFSVGIHFDFGEWALQSSEWAPLYEVVPEGDRNAVKVEVARQLVAFRKLMGRDPTHIDSHQHVHHEEACRDIFLDLAIALAVPLRDFSTTVRYSGGFYGQTGRGTSLPQMITPGAMVDLIGKLEPGITEMGCHPGYADDLQSMYRSERQLEIQALCDPGVRRAIEGAGIELCSFHDVASCAQAQDGAVQ